MNTQKKIEQYLRAAPDPSAPDSLLDRLKADVTATGPKTHISAIRKWFAPTGQSISIRRVAIGAAIAFAVILPLSYGATKVIKYFTISGITVVVKNNDQINTEEDARKVLEEARELYKEGKAEEIKPGTWKVTHSNGEESAYSGNNPEWAGLPDAERKELLKKQSEEVQKLRKAGNFERTFLKEIEENGVRIRLYRDCFTLSNGKVFRMTYGEEVKDNDKK